MIFFLLHFYPSPVLWSFSDSQQWLGLPSLFGLQKVIVFGSVIMHLAFFFFFWLLPFFFFSCEVSTLALSPQPTVVAELPSFPTALGQPLIQQCVPHR